MQFSLRRAAACAALVLAAAAFACSKNEPPTPVPSSPDVGANQPSAYGAANPAKPKFDPVASNGEYFVDWKKPKWALVMTGEQLGYLEPCGCAGLENQKGGLSRRFTFLKELEAREWPLVKVDVGGLIRRFGKQSELKFHRSVEALMAMKYDAVGLGKEDLRLPAGELLLDAAAGGEDDPGVFVSANVGLTEDFDIPKPFKIVEAGGVKIGITAVLSESMHKGIDNSDVMYKPPVEAIEAILPELKERSDVQILLSYSKIEESRELAKKFPDFDVIVSAGGADEPPHDLRTAEGTQTPVIELGHKGMYAVVLGMFDEAEGGIKYQRVALDSRFADAPEMKAMRIAYQDDLKTLGWEGLELRPVEHPNAADADDPAGHFVGAASCKDCHPTAHGIWEKTGHAHATESLTKLDPPRQFDPECISCHSTGWHPTEYYPYLMGFGSLEKTPQLAANSCENCHGPGGAHVAAESARDLSERNVRRQAIRLTRATAEDQVCKKCHDLDNSPEFNFDKYWPKVEHKGKK